MADSSYLGWPFLDDAHRELKAGLEAWLEDNAKRLDPDTADLDMACRSLVQTLGTAGWLKYTVPAPHGVDERGGRLGCVQTDVSVVVTHPAACLTFLGSLVSLGSMGIN